VNGRAPAQVNPIRRIKVKLVRCFWRLSAFDGNIFELQDDQPDNAQYPLPGPATAPLHPSDLNNDHQLRGMVPKCVQQREEYENNEM
jgi:hypothetical protein